MSSTNTADGKVCPFPTAVVFSHRESRWTLAEEISFSILPYRFCDTSGTIVPSTKYIRFRLKNDNGAIVFDQAIDANGSMPIGQWSTVTIPLQPSKYYISSIEFYIKPKDPKLAWDERLVVNIDGLTQAAAGKMDCAYMKILPTNKPVALADKIVSAVYPYKVCIYIQEMDRSSGLRVLTSATGISVGDVVDVTGIVSDRIVSSLAAERQIVNAVVIKKTSTTPPAPLAMNCQDIGGAGIAPYVL